MSKKLEILITSIVGAVSTAGAAIVAYVEPGYTPAIIAAIGIVNTSVADILALFTKQA